MNTYSETIRALKDFHDAKEALVAAEKAWDGNRYRLTPQYDDGNGNFTYWVIMDSDHLGNIARDFLHAYHAYQNLGYPIVRKRKGAIALREEGLWGYAFRLGYALPINDDNE